MGILFGFAPWIIYWVLVGNVPFLVAVLVALATAVATFVISRISGAPGRTLEIGALATFVVLTVHEPVTVVVMPKLDPGTALDLAERERITGIVGWPAFTQRLREHPTFAERDLSSAPMLREGPLDIAMTDVPDGFPVHRTMSETAGGFAFTDMAIVDEHGEPVRPGDTGELLVRGIGVMAGYNKRERSETFDADGWYHTGEEVYRRDGDPRLFYVGRKRGYVGAGGLDQIGGTP